MVRQLYSKPANGLKKFIEGLPEPDRLVLSKTDSQRFVLASAVEGVCQGSGPLLDEIGIYSKFWGFKLEDLRFPSFIRVIRGSASLPVVKNPPFA